MAVAALVLGALLAQPRAFTSGGSQREFAAPAGRRLVLVALDAGDWLTIDPLIKSGALPTLSRLRASGRTGLLIAAPPLISPMVWTTIATGVEPENHGILDFMQDLPGGGQVPVGSTHRLAPALWNLFSDHGRRVAIVGWWATWPAERVRGTIISDAVAPQLTREARSMDAGLVSPLSARSHVSSALVRASALKLEDLASYVSITPAEFDRAQRAFTAPGARFYHDRVAHLAAVIASTRTYGALAQILLRQEHPDLLAVYLEAVDTISHLFVRDARQAGRPIEAAYREADALIGRLARLSTPDTIIVICSDHGFYPATAGITEDPANLTGPATAWHRPYGIIGVATAGTLAGGGEDPSLRGPMDVGSVTPLDIAPTLLHAAGLPVSADMRGRVVEALLPEESRARPPKRALAAQFTPPPVPAAGRRDEADTIERLQALGYVGTVKTSLARLNLGESLLRRGKLAQAERELRAVVAAQRQNLSAWLWLAQALAKQDRAAEALAAYEEAIRLPGGAREALVPAMDLAIRNGRVADASRLVDAARPANDAATAVHVARGALAEANGDPQRAEREYRAALNLDPLSFDAAARFLDVMVSAGRARDALPVIRRAADRAPESPRHRALLGEACLAVRDGAGAEVALRRAVELAPDAEQTRLSLARALLLQKKPADAIAILVPIGASADRDVLLGAAYSDVRDWVRASERLRAALDAGKTTPDVLNGLGWAQLQLGRRDEAAALFERSLAADPAQPEIRRLLAQMQRKNAGERP